MNPRDFFAVAHQLIEAGESPKAAVYRTGIGRSYYAAFNVAKSLIAELRIPLDRQKDSHLEIIDLLAQSEDADLKVASNTLSTQKKIRKDADYDMGNTRVETEQKATMVYLVCNNIVSQIDGVRGDPGRWAAASAKT